MADSIIPANLPDGYDAYLGYVDGSYVTCAAIMAQFPAAEHVCLTVTGATMAADGCDIESLDLTVQSGASWLAAKVKSGATPVGYSSVSNMDALIADLAALDVSRSSVRLLSAHYDAGEHICGPSTCGLVSVPMDGTQWTNTAVGVGGTQIDASVLNDNFFGGGNVGFPATMTMQGGWAWCNKCNGLFTVSGGDPGGVCPAGGQHTGGSSFGYALLTDGTVGS
jgi:hypothetical protein